jgi:hypothetical protein
MKVKQVIPRGVARCGWSRLFIPLVCTLACALLVPRVQAFQIQTDNPDIRMLWDTTVKYSAAFRLEDADAELLSEPFAGWLNTDDGDRNFRNKGLISNRLDVLSEFEFVYKRHFGVRLSGAAWYDSVYNDSNDNDSSATVNQLSTSYNTFTDDTKELHGRKAELLDAFAFGKVKLGASPFTFRVGKHTMLWGESLFFGANGIANGQASIDVIKAVSVPNTQFKELVRPVEQISAQLQVTPRFSLGAYYQWRWEKTRLPAVGSYFSFIDFVPAEGSERLIVGEVTAPFQDNIAFFHGDDLEAGDDGQGGIQARFHVEEIDFGLYAIRYHDKAPQIYLRPQETPNFATGQIGDYLLVYPEDILSYGASATWTIGNVNLAAELSVRRNTPLDSDAQLDLTGAANNGGNPLYAVGNSLHVNFSWLAALGPSAIAREADLLGEIAWNRMTSCSKNCDPYTSSGGVYHPEGALNVNADRDATNIRVIYEPKYRQVWPGVDLSVPLGIGYGISGNYSVVGSFNGEGVGDLSIGLSGSYLDVWRFGVNFTHYFGDKGTYIDSDGHRSFKQALADRDYLSFSVLRAF